MAFLDHITVARLEILAFAFGLTMSPVTALADSSVPRVGGPFTLMDQHGVVVTDATYRGAWMLVFFGFTHCPDICPTTLFHVSRIMKGLEREAGRVQPLFITLDPTRDTPEILREYTSAFDERITGLTGTQAQVAAAAKAYRAHYAKVPLTDSAAEYTFDHQAALYLMDPEGRFVTSFTFRDDPVDITDAILAHLDD